MKTEFKASFLKAIIKVTDKKLKADIRNTILNVESAETSKDIANLKKLKGYKQFYRIRIGHYRIGVKIAGKIVYFVDIDHRSNIYRIFPKQK